MHINKLRNYFIKCINLFFFYFQNDFFYEVMKYLAWEITDFITQKLLQPFLEENIIMFSWKMNPKPVESVLFDIAHSAGCCWYLKTIQLWAVIMMTDLFMFVGAEDRQLFSHAGLQFDNCSPNTCFWCSYMTEIKRSNLTYIMAHSPSLYLTVKSLETGVTKGLRRIYQINTKGESWLPRVLQFMLLCAGEDGFLDKVWTDFSK